MITSRGVDLPWLERRSREIITSLQEANGAYPASPTFSAYRGYCWFRDGSFIADGVSAVGEVASATAFHDWCARVVGHHAGTIRAAVAAAEAGHPLPDAEMLPARFTTDGELGTDDWWDFQLDGYGTWLWAAAEHARRHRLDPGRWQAAADLTVDYLLSSWARPCFDWWEEHSEQVHVSTLGCVAAGLRRAAIDGLVDGERALRAEQAAGEITALIEREGTADGHLTKWLGSDAVDGSLTALIAPLGLIPADSDLARGTIAAVEDQLCVEGGVYRFRADTFFGGGRWPLLSCFLGLAKAARSDRGGARDLLRWAAGTATDDGLLPEQVDGHLLAPGYRQYWIDRWGTPATPLLWSHAMLLRLAAELGEDAQA
ncbi:MAG: glycoside hydrolase family 15 protein [Propionicimonas sp.]|uniref:glycoside hydrolase family 15 protein n=1 Tax=Propionicimonas sp. TaxID=1955623 RepID=UPI002B204BA0|nr:glycoside hydrolase family 15 protein [Propionicimonas sp.]MEA4942888.1 glycoside hydrolase family 15 protein [Propionicimonas sp.]MEA5118248.1 glycoside hydrolase family 15 protein [Propionicimonas sp.]